MKPKYLKLIIYISGFVCAYIFVAIRIHPMFNTILKEKVLPDYWENTQWGELYYFNYIKYFKEKDLPHCADKYRFTPKHPKLDEADVLTFGDSYFDFTRMTTFPEQLGDSLNRKVYYARMDRPLRYLEENKYKKDERKILIYESAERYIPTRFTVPHHLQPPVDHRNQIRRKIADVRDFIFPENTEQLYNVILTRSYFTNEIYSDIATVKFDAFKYIASTTPKYSLKYDIPWLFYYEQTNNEPTSFYYPFTDEEINTYCDNIADLARKLDEKYNLEMVFMPIPSKYTIYHKLINNDEYNNFLPRLCHGLEQRNIPCVDVYNDFMSSDQVLYYGTDTHWNQNGLKIALRNTLAVLDSLKIIN